MVRRAERAEWSALPLFFLVASTLAAEPPVAEAPAATLERSSVPAAERQTVPLHVARFGRYAITVESAQGTALQVVDRMAGPGDIAGEAGKRDGRLDLFLDRGDVRVVTLGPKLGHGDARLAVRPFEERHAPLAPRLIEHRDVDEELADFQQLSWWIDVPERRVVAFEAAGRYLADLRLWQNGSWLVDSAPATSKIDPESGRPLRLCQLVADLEPGLYLLTAYGGAGETWTRSGDAKPFHLRFGFRRDSEANRERHLIGPFGFERVLVPRSAGYFRLELPQPAAASIAVAPYDGAHPFEASGNEAALTKESLPPVAELRLHPAADGLWIATVRGAPGQSYVLQHFSAKRSVELPSGGRYWIGNVVAGDPADTIDATGVVFASSSPGSGKELRTAASQAIPLGGGRSWARRFNLLSSIDVFLQVSESGTYALGAAGTRAVFRLEPLVASEPRGYRPPPDRAAPLEWSLDPGLYVLTMSPLDPGILAVAVAAKGAPAIDLDALAKGGGPSAIAPTPANAAVRFGVMDLAKKTSYTLLVNDQGGVASGPVVRALPLDLVEALPLAPRPGEEIEVPFVARRPGLLRAVAEDGQPIPVALDDGAYTTESRVPVGMHRARVQSDRAATIVASLGLTVEETLATSPLPAMAPERLGKLPEFPTLAPDTPLYFELDRGGSKTFLLHAEVSSLYSLETAGLLATGGSIRTRVVTDLASAAENGTGRNVALRPYLRDGDYQVTVRARGASAGHLGIEARPAAVDDGGALAPGIAARAPVAARKALAYRFHADDAARYRFRAIGLAGPFDVRIEDAEGYPVAAPVAAGDVTLDLAPGDYRALVLPRATEARSIALFERETEALHFEGHGPHDLPLDREVEHTWTEPAASSDATDRAPDVWRFHLPARTEITITLTDEMEGALLHPAAQGIPEIVAAVPPGRGYRGTLAAGDYRLEARCFRRNNQLRYRVKVAPSDLVEGADRPVTAPATVRVALGRDAQVELASFGSTDVRARLYDSAGALVAVSDDRPGDWNFLVARPLRAGTYRLRVDPVAAATAATEVSMRVREERIDAPLVAPGSRSIAVAGEVVVVPLQVPGGGDFVAVGATAPEALGLALEARDGDRWRTLADDRGRETRVPVALRAGETRAFRVRLWSLDGRPASATLSAFAGKVAHRSEADLAHGIDLPKLSGFSPPLAVAAIDIGRPGCFARANDDPLWTTLGPRDAFRAAAATLTPLESTLWLVSHAADPVKVRAERARIGEAAGELGVTIPAGERIRCDVAAPGGAFVLLAAASAGRPWTSLSSGSSAGAGASPDRASAVGAHESIAPGAADAGPSGRAPIAAAVWNAEGDALDVRLSVVGLADSGARAIAFGGSDVVLAGHSARALALPPGAKLLRVTLESGAAFEWGDPSSPEGVAWANEGPREERVASAATSAIVLNPTTSSKAARLEVVAASAAQTAPALTSSSRRFEERIDRAGALRIAIAPHLVSPNGKPQRVRIRGAASATLLGADGSLRRGFDLPAPAGGGTLLLDAAPGYVAAWATGGDADSLAARGFASEPSPVTLALPAAIELAGEIAAYRIESGLRSLVTVRSASPSAIAWLPEGDGARRYDVFPEGTTFDAILAPGAARLLVRPLAGGRLAGRIEIAMQPLSPALDGLGLPALLGPGAARGYLFHVAKAGRIGVGVAADSGRVETVVYDAAGRRLGRGVVQFPKLAAGDYALEIVAAPEDRPSIVRPALVGLATPGNGPPEEIVRSFLELAQGDTSTPLGALHVLGTESPGARLLGAPSRSESAEVESEEANPEGEPEGDTDSSGDEGSDG